MSEAVSLFFDYEDPYKDCDCLPLYTTFDFPKELNPSWLKVRDMSEAEFTEFAEKLRLFFIKTYEEKKIPPHIGYASLETIIARFVKFNEMSVRTRDTYFEEDGKKILKGYNSWGNVVDHWFPDMAEVEVSRGYTEGGRYSIMGTFYNKDFYHRKMKRVLWKGCLGSWKDEPDLEIWPKMKEGIRIGSGSQPVLNIRTSVAKWLYQTYMKEFPGDEIITWDPSMGWAGRMVGFLAANNHPVLRRKRCVYIGTDPSSKLHDRYRMVERFWKKFIDPRCNAEIMPVCMGSEEFDQHEIFKEYKGRVSLVYTSPPYFGKERYSDESTQSYKKFPKYERWKNGFLKKTLENCYRIMKKDGLIFWNIADLRIYMDSHIPHIINQRLNCF